MVVRRLCRGVLAGEGGGGLSGGVRRRRWWWWRTAEMQFRQRKPDDPGQEPDDPGGSG